MRTDKSRSEAAFAMVCEAAQPLLRLIARQYVRSAADAEDVVQHAVARFLEYGPDKANDPRAYMVTCVRNAALDFLKDQKRRTEREQVAAYDRLPAETWLECPTELRERQAAVEQAVGQLPLEQREVVVLKIWGGFTFREIAELTSVSPNTAASRYRYALTALERNLRQHQC